MDLTMEARDKPVWIPHQHLVFLGSIHRHSSDMGNLLTQEVALTHVYAVKSDNIRADPFAVPLPKEHQSRSKHENTAAAEPRAQQEPIPQPRHDELMQSIALRAAGSETLGIVQPVPRLVEIAAQKPVLRLLQKGSTPGGIGFRCGRRRLLFLHCMGAL